jgi:hypothetical protein
MAMNQIMRVKTRPIVPYSLLSEMIDEDLAQLADFGIHAITCGTRRGGVSHPFSLDGSGAGRDRIYPVAIPPS